MLKFAKIKIRYQLFSIFIIMIIIIFVFQLYFFSAFKNIFTDQILDNFTKLASEVQSRIEHMQVDMEVLADNLISDSDTKLYFDNRKIITKEFYQEHLQEKLDTIVSDKSIIYSIMFCNYDKQRVISKNAGFEIYDRIVRQYRLFAQYVPKPFYTSTYELGKEGDYVYGYVYPYNPEKKEFYYQNNYGLCVILCRVGSIREIINSIVLKQEYEYLLVDNDNTILSNNSSYIGNPVQLWIKNIYNMSIENNKRTTFNLYDKTYMFRAYNVKGGNWKLFCIAKMTEIENQGFDFWWKAILAIGMFSLIFGIIVLSVISNITRPITYIVNSLGALENPNEGERIHVIGNNEIEQIIDHINEMLDRMKKLHDNAINSQNEMMLAKLNEKQAQIYTLQSQIKPHFLYNTLGCVKSSATKNEIEKVDDIINSLIKIFRYSIKGNEVVTLCDELDCVREYFHIFEVRYDYRISMMFDVDEIILNKKLPRMILQPIIENALIHGIEKRMTGGHICVKGFIDKDINIKIIISDNGKGINNKELKALNERLRNCRNEVLLPIEMNKSIGLVNVNSRLKFYFGQEYGMYMESTPEKCTSVIITLPFF